MEPLAPQVIPLPPVDFPVTVPLPETPTLIASSVGGGVMAVVVGVETITGWLELVVVGEAEVEVVLGAGTPNVTLTVPPELTVQVDAVPLQPPPLHPVITFPEPGVACSATEVPVLKDAEHVPGQLIPAGELETLPEPVTETVRE